MKKLLLIGFFSSLFAPFLFAADCKGLESKYSAPDPASKTMKQIERWVKRKVKNNSEAKALQDCMIARAADNPDKSRVAGN